MEDGKYFLVLYFLFFGLCISLSNSFCSKTEYRYTNNDSVNVLISSLEVVLLNIKVVFNESCGKHTFYIDNCGLVSFWLTIWLCSYASDFLLTK